MKDRLGNELNIGDICICYNNMRTGSSTSRLVQYEGKVVGFTRCYVKVEVVDCPYYYENGSEKLCSPDNIFKLK